MNYFCNVFLQSGKEQEKSLFIFLDKENFKPGEIPKLTKEILFANNNYKDFVRAYKPKIIVAEYTVYSTEEEIFANTQDSILEQLLINGSANVIAQSELDINRAREKRKKKNIKLSPALIAGILGGAAIVSIAAFGMGKNVGTKSPKTGILSGIADETATVDEDGMIIPAFKHLNSDRQQITISIDRSYSAVPKDDLQIKGEVIDGVANITLPDFDKADFFSHVQGYTWGFSTDPEADKIEYYGGKTYSFKSDTKLYRVLVKYGGGSGTKQDPYIIDYYDQFELMSEEKARGYFKQTADIEFPEWATHKSIDTVNELKKDPETECFEFDGGGYTISGLTQPLFGKVSGAVIKNVNIQNSFVYSPDYKNYGFIVCEAYNYRYEPENNSDENLTDDENKIIYETGETLISHCSVSHSAIYAQYPQSETESSSQVEVITPPEVVPPNLIDENGKPIKTEPVETVPSKHGEFAIGAITGIGGNIENCYVTDFGIYTSLDDCFLYAGGISGKPANVKNSVVYYFAAQGNIFHAGGIAGSGSGVKMYDPSGKELPDFYGGNFQGCAARNIMLTTELSAGGIIGEGTTNADNAIISNCYSKELNFNVGIYEDDKLVKAGDSGGIIGTDGNEINGHKIFNSVSPAELNAIGKPTKSEFDNTIRLAPNYAYCQSTILNVINCNTIDTKSPGEIYAGSFIFDKNGIFADENGNLPFPEEISDLFGKVYVQNSNGNN